MTSSSSIEAEPANHPSKGGRFRIQDSGRALGFITALVLVSGFVALRALTGGANAPTVDVEATQRVPVVEPKEDDGLHKLRPQTSSTSPLQEHDLGAASAIRKTAEGPLMPAAHWDPLAPHDWLDEPAARVGAADESEIFR